MRIILIAFLLFVIDTLNAQESRFKEGETLNVWATSGLNMRDKPDAKAVKFIFKRYLPLKIEVP